jgi:carbonic anhydrase/acetyltransferase-like protein (isoleucine patch superfamily)
MRKVIIRKPRHIPPFNEPASRLSVLNRSLGRWQRDLLASYCDNEIYVDQFYDAPRDTFETLVVGENLWFDEPFLTTFIEDSKRRKTATRATFRANDQPFLQQGLKPLTKSYERFGDLYAVDLWYFPNGITDQTEAVVIPSDARDVGYHHIPNFMGGRNGDLVWWLPQRAVCAIDSWVHVFFANIVFGIFAEASRIETRSTNDALFRLSAAARALVERKDLTASSAYVKIGKNCSIDPSTVFQGPVSIGDDVTIGPGCVITQCVIGNNVTLTHSNHFHMCVINDDCFFPFGAGASFSVFMDGSSAAHTAAIEMSVVGRNSYIGAGTIFTDFNLMATPMHTSDSNALVEIDMPVLGACVGHNCRVGSGLLVYPGRTIESDVILIASPTRRVLMKNIAWEESDHHAMISAGADHPRKYPREDEAGVDVSSGSGWG